MTRPAWTWVTPHDIRAVLPRILRAPIGATVLLDRVGAAVGEPITERRLFRALGWCLVRGTIEAIGARGHRVYARRSVGGTPR